MREEDGRTVSVVWMYVTDFHVLQSVFVVVFLAILSLVLDIRHFWWELGDLGNLHFVCGLELVLDAVCVGCVSTSRRPDEEIMCDAGFPTNASHW